MHVSLRQRSWFNAIPDEARARIEAAGESGAKVGVELTDSIYVVLNMRIMARMGAVAWEHLGDSDDFNRGLHCLLDVNPVFCERVGMNREALIGRSMVDLGVGMTPEDSERLMTAMREKGRVRDFETRVRDLTGRERYVLFNGEVIDYDGRPAVLTISHDVRASRHAERALAERDDGFGRHGDTSASAPAAGRKRRADEGCGSVAATGPRGVRGRRHAGRR